MKKGFIESLIYYAICSIIFIALTVFLEKPRHFPGLNYLFLFLLLIISLCLIAINVSNILRLKNRMYNTAALAFHLTFAGGLIIWYVIGYYSQFG